MYASKPNYGSRVTRDNLLRDAPTKTKLHGTLYIGNDWTTSSVYTIVRDAHLEQGKDTPESTVFW
jgi:hypothetical protein